MVKFTVLSGCQSDLRVKLLELVIGILLLPQILCIFGSEVLDLVSMLGIKLVLQLKVPRVKLVHSQYVSFNS